MGQMMYRMILEILQQLVITNTTLDMEIFWTEPWDACEFADTTTVDHFRKPEDPKLFNATQRFFSSLIAIKISELG